MSASSGRDCKKGLTSAITTRGSDSMRRYLMVIHTFRQLEANEPVDTQRLVWSFAPFPKMSAYSGRDGEKVSLLLLWLEGLIAYGDTSWLSAPLSSRDNKSFTCGNFMVTRDARQPRGTKLVSYPNFVRGSLLDGMRPFFGPCEVLGTHH